MSEAADRKYDDVSTAANRVLIKCAVAFEKRWMREDEPTRAKLLEQAITHSTAFGPTDAERIRANTRDVGVICQLLEAIATAFGMNPDDPSTVRQYRNSL
ncbi:MAG: hypothetical protein IT348_01910, partial [Candidatus Eisenbacteria bacterium]|nr:hypothetical protein [Candidatus Eisenbacteria bacterium]